MNWKLDQAPVDGVMFRGEPTAPVSSKRTGMRGLARVVYNPHGMLVGPVVGLEADPKIPPEHADDQGRPILDRTPRFHR